MEPTTNGPGSEIGAPELSRRKKLAIAIVNPLLKYLLIAITAAVIVLLLWEGILAVKSPCFQTDDEWQGAQFIAGLRLLQHEPIYADFHEAGAYSVRGPLVPVLLAAAMWLFGIKLVVVKILAFVACLVALVAVAVGGRRLADSWFAGFVAAGVFAASYPFANRWHLDIRPEIFATAFAVLALLVADKHVAGKSGRLSPLLVAALLALAALCKEDFALLALFYMGFVLVAFGWRAALLAAVPTAAIWAAAILIFSRGSESYWATMTAVIILPFRPPAKLWPMFSYQYGTWQVIPVFLAIASLYAAPRADLQGARRAFWIGSYVIAFLLGLIPFAQEGGYTQSFLFFAAVTAVLGQIILFHPKIGGGAEAARHLATPLLAPIIFLAVQAGIMSQLREGPRVADVPISAKFIEMNKGKRIYYPARNYLTYLIKGEYFPCDLQAAYLSLGGEKPPRQLARMIENQDFDCIIGRFWNGDLQTLCEKYYTDVKDYRLGRLKILVPTNRKVNLSFSPEMRYEGPRLLRM
ncbi:MAG: hypothetical protein JXQ73_12000 [Phycisphaerae bacterium]|nr:hypothetical protein [Phycisphaerae bacterium]